MSVNNLSVFYKNKSSFFFKNKDQDFQAVNNLSFEISKGETLGIVGESGSGKSSVAQALIKLITSEGNFFLRKKIFHNLMKKALDPIEKIFKLYFKILLPR